jgi:hypothetical protein
MNFLLFLPGSKVCVGFSRQSPDVDDRTFPESSEDFFELKARVIIIGAERIASVGNAR